MRGGVRAGAGRPPAETSRAKDRAAKKGKPPVIDDGTWLTLPHEGRGGNPPAWPLSAATTRERVVWRQLWKLPEALGWERVGNVFQVALHVRTLVRAEDPESAIGLANLVRLQQAELGLTPAGKQSLRWKIGRAAQQQATPTPSESDAAAAPVVPTKVSPRDRMGMKLVTGA